MPSVLTAQEELQPGLLYKGVDVACNVIEKVGAGRGARPADPAPCTPATSLGPSSAAPLLPLPCRSPRRCPPLMPQVKYLQDAHPNW